MPHPQNYFLVMAALISSALSAQSDPNTTTLFDRWDINGDGKLSSSELPARVRGNFKRVDTDGNGFISRQEDAAFRRRGQPNAGAKKKNDLGDTALPPQVKVVRNVAYIPGGHARQKLDLYFFPPKDPQSGKTAEKPKPLIIWIHGGAWRAGSKDRCRALFMLNEGYAVASLNYRYSQHAVFPAQIQDCKTAIRWLRTHHQNYNLDPDHFGVWGSSAGGHLSALVGTSGDSTRLTAKPTTESVSSRVQAVCDWFGPIDMLQMNSHSGKLGRMDHDSKSSPESQLIGGPIQENVAKVARANPITYLSPADPPFLIMHGDADRLVSVRQSMLFHQELKKKNIQSELVIIKGGGHGGFDPARTRPQIIQFFNRHLK